MTYELYLHQSRRLSRIIKGLFGIKTHWTNYAAWEYKLSGNRTLELTYTNDREVKRFNVHTYYPKYTSLLNTDSLKEFVEYMNKSN